MDRRQSLNSEKGNVRRPEMAKQIMTLKIAADKRSFKLRENAN
jgi:hypothetical protein